MNWDALGAIGELVGAGAVVVTLIYLATQVRETRRAIVGQTDMDYTRELIGFQSRLAMSRERLDVWMKAATNAALTEEEGLQYVALSTEYFLLCDGCFRQWERGLMPDSTFEVITDTVVSLIEHDNILERWWEARITPFSPNFIEYIEAKRQTFEGQTFRREGAVGSMERSLSAILKG